MFKINSDSFSNIGQGSVYSVEKCVFRNIILWSNPFALENSPKRFSDVQMWRIWWKIEKKQPTLFPKVTQCLNLSVSMDRGIIEYNKCIFFNLERESIEKINDFICIYTFCRAETIISVIAVYHSEDVKSVCLQGRNIYIFVMKLPSVRNISFGVDMAFVSKIKIDLAISFQLFKFLQLLSLVLVELREGTPLGRFLIRLYLAPMLIKNV